ncbi:FG-GAP-like repeat-containing protein [Nonomuraea sp. NPDC050556]|uniref:FG-GAP-like repeat-containing protein n=1 Tax=Nonomuraea sp. NPDC050556 TaxID=3364369 RepID=UPI0037901590
MGPTAQATADPGGAALTEARRTGQRVEVEPARTETTEVFAEPDGTMTAQQHLRPVRARVGGEWRAIDPTLKANPDGTLSPAVSTFAMTFSGGGTGPMATLAKGGKSLSMAWPGTLPKPALEGNTATYAEVLPGVDLKIIVEPDGFTHHLVVKTREAGTNPAVRTLKLGMKGNGLSVSSVKGGGLKAADAKGEEIFSAPVPRMWDSSHERSRGIAAGGDKEELLREAPMKATAGRGGLEIVPDRALLDDPATVYPVVIDPAWRANYKNHWAVAAKRSGTNMANTAYYDGGNRIGSEWPPLARVGYESETGVTARSFFEMNLDGIGGTHVLSARFRIFNAHSWSSSPRDVELGLAGAIGGGTTWNNQPQWIQTLGVKSFAHGWNGTDGANEEFDITGKIQEAANGWWPHITLGLKAGNEGDTFGWKKFVVDATGDWQNYVPTLVINYNNGPRLTAKTAYQGQWNNNSSDRPIPCGPGWQLIGNTDVVLTATGQDPNNDNLEVKFGMWFHDGPSILNESRWIGNNGTASVVVRASQLENNGHYWWYASVNDGTDGDWSTASCPIKVDKLAPNTPEVTSDDGKSIDVAQVAARNTRKIRLRSADWNGLRGFCYVLNATLSVHNGQCATGTWVDAGSDGSAVVEIYPHRWPNNTLQVMAVDLVGNVSPLSEKLIKTAPADFVADPNGVISGDRDGDLSGDGYPDLLAVNTDGGLRLYRGRGDGTVAEGQNVSWTGFGGGLVAHRGDFLGAGTSARDGYEDIFVRTTDGKLQLFPNEGTGWPSWDGRRDLRHPGGSDWSGVTRLVAPGDLDGDRRPDLLTVEGNQLRLYRGGVAEPLVTGAGGELAEPATITVPGLASLEGYDVYVPGGTRDLVLRKRDSGVMTIATGQADSGTYSVEAPRPYGDSRWPGDSHPWIVAPGNLHGRVVDVPGEDYRMYEPVEGKEGADFWLIVQPEGLYLSVADAENRQQPFNVGIPGTTYPIASIS